MAYFRFRHYNVFPLPGFPISGDVIGHVGGFPQGQGRFYASYFRPRAGLE